MTPAQKSASPIVLPRVHKALGMRFVSVTGGKGGVGKSSIAVNLALGLSALGGRVLVLDGDLGLANADQILGVHVGFTLWDVVSGATTLEEAIVHTPWKVDLLPTASGRRELVEMNEHARHDLLKGVRALEHLYDYVVIDTAAGIGDSAMSLAAAGDFILGVTTPDPTSIRDLFSVMKVLSKEFKVQTMEVVPNMVSSNEEGLDIFKRISSVSARFLPLSLRLAGTVMRDRNMARSIIERTPLLAGYPGSPASYQLNILARGLVKLGRESDMAAHTASLFSADPTDGE